MDLVHRDCSATWDYHQPTGKMNPESVEASIQGLLSALYPPFHATAPTLLSQLLQRIQERYQGDALRCLLNFLVPAKHILESVQQAACAGFSGVLFQSEGWPLCLGDRVVLQLAPLSPLLLRPGDFYLQVAPFSQQAARILVCSLLEEEELHQDRQQLPQVEETPIPETTYTCIFTSDWLREVNEGRRGTPLSRCLLVADQAVVRLPWEEVAQPRFVDKPRTMAPPPAPPPLPPTVALPRPAQHSSSGPSLPPCDSGFAVETRICPAKHGIAVSLCLVDRGAPSRQTRVHRAEDTAQTRGWVSGHPWDSRCAAKGAPRGGVDVGTGGTTFWEEPKGEYVDLMEFTQQMGASRHSSQDHTETRTQEQECTQEPTHTQSCSSPHTLPHAQVQSRTHPWISLCRPSKPAPSPPAQHEPQPLHQQPAPPRESPQCAGTPGYCEEPCSPCLRRRLTLQDSEGPWAPGLELNPGQEQSLGLGRGPSRAQELRCRYRESYQAALQNPVCFSREREKEEGREREKSTERGNILTVVEEDCLTEGNLKINGGGGEHSQHRSTALQPCSVTPQPSYRTPEQHFSGPQQFCAPTPISGTAPAPNTPHLPCKESSLCKESGEHCSVHCGTSWNVTSVPTAESERMGAVTSSVSADPDPDGRCSSLSTAVVDTSERCELVVQGRTLRRDRKGKGQRLTARRDSDDSSCSEAMVPRLHVVKCKNATAFGLVSPKNNRRGKTCTEGTQACELPKPCSNQPEPGNQPEPASQPQNQIPPGQHFQQQSFEPFTSRPEASDRGLPDPCSLPLHLGLACLTGGRDRMGRAVVEVYSDRDSWRPQSRVSSQDLYQMLLYFHSIIRQEIRELGMTIVIDARKTPPPPQFLQSVMMLQKQTFPVVHAVLVLESCRHPDTHSPAGLQTEAVSSLRALNKMVDSTQLTLALEGTLPYSHLHWLQLHKNLQPFVSDLQQASGLLLRSIERLEGAQRIGTVQEVQQSITGQRTLMRDVLMDGRLVFLQREGGAILARLRRESDLRYPHYSDYSAALEAVAGLYSQVEEQAHILVRKSNAALEHLEYLLQLRHLEEHFTQIREWFTAEGERRLLEAEAVEDPRERVEQTLQSFCSFLTQAGEQQLKAESLVREAERLQTSSYPETEVFRTMVNTFQSVLAHFLSRAERCRWELEALLHICHFCQEATLLAEECRRYLEQDPLQDRDPAATLHSFQERFVQFSPDCFQEVKAQACALRGSRGMRVWNVAWLRCQEVRQHLEERLGDLEQSWQPQQRHTGPWAGPWCAEPEGRTETAPPAGQEEALFRPGPGPDPAWERPQAVSSPNQARLLRPHGGSSSNSPVVCCSPSQRPLDSTAQGSDATMTPSYRSTRKTEREARKGKNSRARDASLSRSHTIGCQWFPWQRGLGARSMSEESCAASSSQSEAQAPARFHGQPSRRVLQAAQRFQISRHGSFCSQDSCSGTEGPGGSREATSSTGAVESSKALKLQHIVEELLLTEREYVRSLAYILTHYLPLLDRPDVPQDLRGKRALIFGNLERLYDFHHRHFLCELEACQREPLLVARCFLRHRESLGLYALYSKNKPQSDALILHHRHDIFKRKQVELGDLMDLPSYLLRPIQRISKYSLLLNDLLALWSPRTGMVTRESERAEIQAAADLVRFQMRHGNDLLTMDAIQDCDVNLQEQGELIRQDEFTVFYRRKRSIRRVFLFQHLILFSKTKKTNVGNDVYVYKQSFKTCDIGMTHTSGASGLCFEIWFRRRRAEDTYTLRADRSEVKAAWTADLDQLLWEQATHNRELRVQERLFMGLGRKSFQEIRPVCDRDVHPIPPGTVPAACHLTTGGEHVRPNSIGSGSSTSTSCSQSSSSSGRGSLPPVTYLGNQSQGPETNHIVCSCPEGVVDENLCNHHNLHHVHPHPHQKHRLLKDSSMSSGENVSALSNSEPSCLSGIGGDVVDSSSFTSQNSQPCAATANHKKSQSPGTPRRRPSLAPKPLGLIPSLGLLPSLGLTPSLGLKVTCGPPAADMT